jgi:hypothetical protein
MMKSHTTIVLLNAMCFSAGVVALMIRLPLVKAVSIINPTLPLGTSDESLYAFWRIPLVHPSILVSLTRPCSSAACLFHYQTNEQHHEKGDINILILTDTHSWVGGHGRQEPTTNNANYGDVLSFHTKLKQHCLDEGLDLFFVNNGDWVDGTGLSAPGDPSSLVPLLEKMPWDAVNCTFYFVLFGFYCGSLARWSHCCQ